MKKPITLVSLAVLVLKHTSSGLAFPMQADETVDVAQLAKQLQEGVGLDQLQRHTLRFQAIADNFDGHRQFGSNGHHETVKYITDFLNDWKDALDIDVQTIMLPHTEVEQQKAKAMDTNEDIEVRIMSYSASTPGNGIEAELVHVASSGCLADDLQQVTNKIVLVARGGCSFVTKSQMARQAGAVGLLMYDSQEDRLFRGTLGTKDNNGVPSASVSKTSAEALVRRLATGPVHLSLQLVQHYEERQTYNIIAETKKGNKSNVIVLGAHTDGVRAGPGINDNGSGSAALMELARLSSSIEPQNAIRFCWWSGEEEGLLGSSHYVQHMPEEDRRRMSVYLNFDMIASPNYISGIYDGSSTTNTNTPVPPGSMAITSLFRDFFSGRQLPHDPVEFNGRSDYRAFAAAGIPSGGLFSGAEGKKTLEQAVKYGGNIGESYDPCYHQACDTIKNLHTDAFVLHTQAIAHVLASLATSTAPVDAERSSIQAKDLTKNAVAIQDSYIANDEEFI